MPYITGETTEEPPAPVVEVTRPPAEVLTWSRLQSGNYVARTPRHGYMARRLGRPASDPWWQLIVDGARIGDAVPLLRDAKTAGQALEDS